MRDIRMSMNTRRSHTLTSTLTETQVMIIATRSQFVGRIVTNTPTSRSFTIICTGLIFITGTLITDVIT